jgi:hypothetical protein
MEPITLTLDQRSRNQADGEQRLITVTTSCPTMTLPRSGAVALGQR